MKCPECNCKCEQDVVDVGVGVIHGPWGCFSCGWSENEEYSRNPDPRIDCCGGLTPLRGMQMVNQSKFLSLVLRHKPETINLTLDEQGWADVGAVLSGCHISMDELEEIVEHNNKKRFEFNEDKSQIRASQGHSVKINLNYEAQTPPDTLYHGTVQKNWDIIQHDGLKKMKRHHVHLSVDKDTAIQVGKRRGKPIVISVDSGKMSSDGFVFYLSTNGVWLTENVPREYMQNDR